jgi:hypothetical protein
MEKAVNTPEKPHVNLMICTPGHSMMAEYVKSLLGWNALANEKKITWGFSTGYSSHVADAREITISGTKQNSLTETRPFEGNLTYDKLMWIDSDIEFLPQDILKLYESDKDIVTGAYLLANGDVMAFRSYETGPLTIKDVEELRDYEEVTAAGFGFICVKQGVFESLSRPWFQSAVTKVTLNDVEYDMPIMGEDVSWCHRAKEKGYKIYLDPLVKVNHHKMMKLTWKGIQSNG